MWLSWLIEKWFYYRGIRFYESKDLPSSAESLQIQFTGTDPRNENIKVTFEFFREIYKDSVYRKGRFFTKEGKSFLVGHTFLVKAQFDGIADEKFLRFNDTRLLCKSGFFALLSDETVANVLQGLYIAYIKDQISTTK